MSPTPPSPASSQAPLPGQRRLLLLFLAALAVFELRGELRLLLDHVTVSALLSMVRAEPLAVMVLLALPGLWRRR